MKVNYKSAVIFLLISLAVIFCINLIIQVSQPDCFIYVYSIPRDQIDFEKDVIVHLDEEDFNAHPVLREVVTGEKPLSRIFIRDRGAVDCREQQLMKNIYCQDRPGAYDYKIFVEWNENHYELLCYIT